MYCTCTEGHERRSLDHGLVHVYTYVQSPNGHLVELFMHVLQNGGILKFNECIATLSVLHTCNVAMSTGMSRMYTG